MAVSSRRGVFLNMTFKGEDLKGLVTKLVWRVPGWDSDSVRCSPTGKVCSYSRGHQGHSRRRASDWRLLKCPEITLTGAQAVTGSGGVGSTRTFP